MDLDEYIIELRQRLSQNPECAVTHYNLGIAFIKKQKWEEAIYEFNRALEESPDFVEALVNMGGIYFQLGDIEKSIEVNEPSNNVSDFEPLLTFGSSEDILLNYNSEEFYEMIFELGQNSEYWLDFDSITYGIGTNLQYPNVDITSIMFLEHSRYAYVATYNQENSDTRTMVTVALDAETGQLLYYWHHTDNGFSLF